ncbi:MAG: hypothetical protein L3J08_07245 [Flavobacteriaceae bacterium]|nr:hypothetical protein [Flavobacteriaceae bacterium]
MNKIILILSLVFSTSLMYSQTHDYDDQSVIYSTPSASIGGVKRVGIGINTPQERLQVNGNILINEVDDSGSSYERGLFFKNPFSTNQKYDLSIFNLEETPERYFLSINAYNGLYFNTGSHNVRNTRMIITRNGNIGIGTEEPFEKLHINGNIMLNTFGSMEGRGIFFREGYSETNKYNLSIFNDANYASRTDSSDPNPPVPNDALSINAFDGLYFNTGSNDKNTRMLIHRNGNVGIGTETPNGKLDINGKAITQTALINPDGNNGQMLQMGQTLSNGKRLFNFGYSNNLNRTSENQFLGYTISRLAEESTTDIPDEYVGYSVFSSNNTVRLEFGAKNSLTYFGMKDNTGDEIFKISRTPEIGSYFHMPKTNSRIVIGSWGNYLLAEGHKLVIKDGSAKIEGELTLQNKLTVQGEGIEVTGDSEFIGKILAKEIKVTADFVFEEEYDLPTLKSVEEYILANKHLPEVASADEMKKNGIYIVEMNIKLLQKIEELTLYTIAQEKKIDSQEKRMQLQEERLTAIEKQLKK